MLIGQAYTLQNIFANLSRRAGNCEHLPYLQTYTRLALKAQAQCRATLEVLTEIRNPRSVAFVQQANIAQGLQQVNNGGVPAPAEKNATLQNELLEATHERMDTGPQIEPGGAYSTLEAVGTINRAAHR